MKDEKKSPDLGGSDVAVVGVGGRFPQARGPEQLWENLRSGRCAITAVPPGRWSDAALAGEFRGGFVEDADCFDAAFFKISPKEAELMDPQQRMLLEVLWHTLEDARVKPSSLEGRKVGVFMGVCNDDYAELLHEHDAYNASLYGSTGTSGSILSNRVSFFFDFRGPSVTVDTACSSSLVAVHLAARAIRAGECEAAFAGGANLCWTESRFLAFRSAGMLSKDGVCRTFDARANGYLRGEGAGAVLLKPLRDALRDGDYIYGVIKGGAINHGGRTRGLTVTSPAQQRQLLIDAYRDAGVHPDTVGYIETHGTGTSLGDPIEFLGLKQAFEALREQGGERRARPGTCALGALKTNIGHLEAAAGVAGLIKVLLSLKHGAIPGNLHFDALNSRISLDGTSFYFPTSTRAWPAGEPGDGAPRRRAGVSAFGYGGAYAHVVVEEHPAPPPEASAPAPGPHLVALSAPTPARLRVWAEALLEHIGARVVEAPVALSELAYSLQTTREEFEERLALIAEDSAALSEQLRAFVAGVDPAGCFRGNVRTAKGAPVDAAVVEAHIGGRALSSLAELWVRGQSIPWRGLYAGAAPRTIALPLFPFERRRYWVTRRLVAPAPEVSLTVAPPGPAAIEKPSGIALRAPGEERFAAPAVSSGVEHTVSLSPVGAAVNQAAVVAGSAMGAAPYGGGSPAGGAASSAIAGVERVTPRATERGVGGHMPGTTATARDRRASPVDIAAGARTLAALEQELTGSLAEALFMDRADVEPDRPFMDLGLDSIVGVEWVRVINTTYGLSLPATCVYDHPTIRRLAAHLSSIAPRTEEVSAVAHRRPRGGAAEAGRARAHDLGALEEGLTSSLAEALYTDRAEIDPDRPFTELGLDSIVGVEWIRVINKAYGLSLPATCVYDHPTIGRLARHLSPMLGGVGAGPSVQHGGEDALHLSRDDAEGRPGDARAGAARSSELDALHGELAKSLADALYMDPGDVDVDRPFVDLGLDSIVGVEWTRAINKAYGVSLPATRLYDHSTVRRLAAHLSGELDARAAAGRPVAIERERPALGGDIAARPAREPEARAPRPAPEHEGIAVIGMSGAFPKARGLDEFWENIARGVDCVTEIPPDRWAIAEHYDPRPDAPRKTYSKWMGVLDDVDRFDPLFFGITPTEAELMDPQQRLFLEHCWSCIESAGIDPQRLSGSRCGVYVGCMPGDYVRVGDGTDLTLHWLMGSSSSILAARISYCLNLKGPCLAIDTACSSSLVAIVEACDSLLLGRSDLALAGGVSVAVRPETHIIGSGAGMLSPRGRCFTFDARADGFVPAECVGVVLLKRLADAVRDGDIIAGVLRGWALNQDGRTNGITAPSVTSQAALQKQVYDHFGIDPETISLVEAHGTGTKLGDPIEVQALTESFRAYTDEREYCALGSVKSNIGHGLAGAGVAGVLKVLLALRHERLPPTIHYATRNEHITFEGSPFYVNTELRPWARRAGSPRRAAVNSFGFSGTNAHVVIEEAPPRSGEVTVAEAGLPVLIVLSAKRPERLEAYAAKLARWLERQPALDLTALAYTLQIGREAMAHRAAFVADGRRRIVDVLGELARGVRAPGVFMGQAKRRGETGAASASDAATGRLLGARAREERLSELGELWVQGTTIAWDALYQDRTPARLSIPTYPFARERYWFPLPGGTASAPLLFEPRWDAKESAGDAREGDRAAARFARRCVLAEPAYEDAARALASACPGTEIEALRVHGGTLADRFAGRVEQVFERVRELLRDRLDGRALLQVVVSHQGEGAEALAGVSGLLKTASRENPDLVAQLVQIASPMRADELAARLRSDAAASDDRVIRYREGGRYVATVAALAPAPDDGARAPGAQAGWKSDGVYLIAGGGGGIGRIVARDIVEHADGATVLLAGRSPLTGELRAALDALRAAGERRRARVEYLTMDVADVAAVEGRVRDILERYGRLSGVIHAAGVLRDGFIVRKPTSDLHAVLAPKVRGVVHLDRATARLPLDFFAIFSSIAGVFGNVGQADYAAANGFLDGYAAYRDRLVADGERRGRTIAIAWPLWADGGMHVDPVTAEALDRAGLAPLSAAQGLAAFHEALTSSRARVVVLAGGLDRLQAMGVATGPAPAQATRTAAATAAQAMREAAPITATRDAAAIDPRLLEEKTLRRLRGLFADVTKLPSSQIDPEESLELYGIDSLLIMRLNEALSKAFGDISKTLWFEYQTLAALAGHLSARHAAACARWTGMDRLADAPVHAIEPGGAIAPLDEGARRDEAPLPRSGEAAGARPGRGPIAIIGLSGRYPQADDVGELWDHLKAGRSCTREIPADRWSLDGFYEPDPEQAVMEGKSYGKWGGFIDGFADFDPLFFNVSPRESMNIDPQERLFIECCWSVLEDAGYTRDLIASRHGGRVGVFAGITKTGFDLHGPEMRLHDRQSFPHTSFGSVANRVSYLLNLRGPSMPIDTMCSSSLTAIHEACEHLLRDECEIAIAGGVNLYVHPSTYVGLSAQRMLSRTGHCKSFGEGGDGFVPGECVGAVLLKPLQRAIDDGDHIYAVVKGTSINHGGKTNGYTVPNPVAQRELILSALARAGVDARAVSYVEAHGTGTELGDPIELAGLTQAFRAWTEDREYCAIGSVKSNIGHCESAAGIAGVTKVVLQMKHGVLVPSLHSERLNPHIDFEDSPFFVQRELSAWRRPVVKVDGKEREHPRIAGVSSFGAGGANAHVVLEEYVERAGERGALASGAGRGAVAVVLSARSAEALRRQASRLRRALERGEYGEGDLEDIAYTLQTGREAMEHRLGFIASNLDEVKSKLSAYERGAGELEEFWQGEVKREKEMLSLLGSDEELQEAIGKWALRGKYARLLELWVKGLAFDWSRVHAGRRARRVSLPTYPFERERYWLPSSRGRSEVSVAGRIHPLVHANTSSLSEERFTSEFTGQEPFFADHVVDEERVLPGVAYLEMARRAVQEAVGGEGEVGEHGIELHHVVWSQPIVQRGAEAVRVHVQVESAEGSEPAEGWTLRYEIYSGGAGVSGERVVHSQGYARLVEKQPALRVDVSELRSRCEQERSGASCYAAFDAMGLHYGPSHRGLVSVWRGEGTGGERFALARVQLPASAVSGREEYVLHPSVLDSALQATIALSDGQTLRLPFALDAMQVFGASPSSGYVVIREERGGEGGGKLTLELCDDGGVVCVRLAGFASRAQHRSGVELLQRRWRHSPVEHSAQSGRSGDVQRWVLLDSAYGSQVAALSERLPGAQVTTLRAGGGVAEEFEQVVEQVMTTVQTILRERPRGEVLLQVALSRGERGERLGAVSGLLKSASQENPKLVGQVLELEDSATLLDKLEENAAARGDVEIRYQGGERQTPALEPVVESRAAAAEVPWKQDGVYLITGGAGGLGLLFAKEIIDRAPGATLILTGRSRLSGTKQAAVESLRGRGSRVEYMQLDVSDGAAVSRAVEQLQSEHGGLNGLVHAAGVLQDSFVVNKTEAQWRSVLGPKVRGLVHLDEATKHLPLDHMVVFSSVAGLVGNVGQADYAAANAFMARFAEQRSELVRAGRRQGRTVSIDWPLWESGGMQVDASTVQRLRQTHGVIPLATEHGIAAFYRTMASGLAHVGVVAGDVAKWRSQLVATHATAGEGDASHDAGPTAVASDVMEAKAAQLLRKVLSSSLKVPLERIDADAPLDRYGIESVMVMELTRELEKTFGPLSKTLFFEHQDIRSLSRYFAEAHRRRLIEVLGGDDEPAKSAARRPQEPASASAPRRDRLVTQPRGGAVARPLRPHDIAIIGVSGRYPGADDLEAFWENLKSGRDCITEIPEDRWSLEEFFDPQRGKPGKIYSRWGGFIDGVDRFDPLFFNISPREAQIMDPQERLFLECAYETIEDAGYTRDALKKPAAAGGPPGTVGVFVGVMYEEYQLFGAQAQVLGQPFALNGNPSSIANRVSYFLDCHGPSMAVDTMCSSSLTAIHLACQSLLHGGCDLAIAGGVNVSIHPNKYLALSQGQFASSRGRCESFGEGGDGYVPAEGVGAVLLKPLQRAIDDGDHVYAVVKGTSINHGGKTNGYTVPSPMAQAQLVAQALTEAKIEPRAVSYVEAHGTGTELGDPIELAGLTQAFRRRTEERGYCAIGSVKSNIGHCESAAGIAGVTKVVLQMKHGVLVPSLHSERLNPHINFEDSPFFVQRELSAWRRPVVKVDGKEREHPRIAGVSSFGAGGANAHVVLEEYVERAGERGALASGAGRGAVAVVLSARSAEALRRQASRLRRALERGEYGEGDLEDIAYTLQTGREAMEHRLGFIASNLDEVKSKLSAYEGGAGELEEFWQGEVKREKEMLSLLGSDEELQEAIGKWALRGKYARLLELWVKGLAFDWSRVHAGRRARRVSLPTYPFERERYWLPSSRGRSGAAGAGAGRIHPLVHANTSSLSEERFTSEFTGQEPFFADHVVDEERVLPGVAYLEMARRAVQEAVGGEGEIGEHGIELHHVVWSQPIVQRGAEAVRVHVQVESAEGSEPAEGWTLRYEIYSGGAGVSGERVVHSQGYARLVEKQPAPRVDVSELRSRCEQERSGASCYGAFDAMGLHYGPSHRGLVSVWRGEGTGGERFALARVQLPASAVSGREEYVLHPSVLDSALQATIALSDGQTLRLPFALDAVQVFGASPSSGYVVIREERGGEKLTLELCDDGGVVCVRLAGFASRAQHRSGVELLQRRWRHSPVEHSAQSGRSGDVQRWVLLDSAYGSQVAALSERLPGAQVTTLRAGGGVAEEFEQVVEQVMTTVQTILRERPRGEVLLQVALSRGERGERLGAVSGLLKSASQENPKLVGQVLELEDSATLLDKLEENAAARGDVEIRYQGGERQTPALEPVVESRAAAVEVPWKQDGVYLITGGAGGLGLLFAKEIIDRAPGATLILTGRSRLSGTKQAAVESLRGRGSRVEYMQLDVSDGAAVSRAVEQLQSEHGGLNGLVHAAGVLQDSFVVNKTEAQWRSVLGPKVRGLVHLDEATKHLPLDHMVVFSSVAGLVGNVGQADYAAANAFMARFAEQRSELVRAGRRQGRTVSIDWPLWESGGMQVDASTVRRLRQTYGVTPLATEHGIAAFYRTMASGLAHVGVVAGDVAKWRSQLVATHATAGEGDASHDAGPTAVASDVMEAKAAQLLRKVLSSSLKVPLERIDADAPLDRYGIESVMVMELTRELEKTFGPLSKTLFFEHQDIRSLSRYFAEAHRRRLIEVLGGDDEPAKSAARRPQEPASASAPRRDRLVTQPRGGAVARPLRPHDIAIIGVSGRYPGADDLEAFWENLKSGRDCITEIPEDRWSLEEFFDPQRGKPGKTYSRWGGFIDGVDRFDPLFFNISPREAQIMDPQERLFLECAYETIEDAGYTRDALRGPAVRGRVGVFVGVMYEEYLLYGLPSQDTEQLLMPSVSPSSIANRVSYFCNFQGPSVAVDTMCSSSLTAIHFACRSILEGECELAIAGGVNVSIHPNKYLALSQAQFVSSRGRCESFGEGGDGYVPAEGVGAVLLKPLQRAIDDGDHIYAVVKGTSINHGGKTNGYTVPNPAAQSEVIAAVLERANVDARAVSYVEAHGTGTPLGDPIELAGLTQAFRRGTEERGYCAIGSVKSNIGHCESAAGIAGVTKVVLQMKHGALVPSLHSERLNPHIDFENSPFFVQRELSAWRRPVVKVDGKEREHPRIAGVSSFGAGGANASVVLEEYVERAGERGALASGAGRGAVAVVLSARSAEALRRQASRLRRALELGAYGEGDLEDIAYTLQTGREAMEHRLGFIASNLDEVKSKLSAYERGGGKIDEFWQGEVKREKEMLSLLGSDEELQEAIGKWALRGKYARLLELWVKGLAFDWSRVHAGRRARRVSLPTYPFERERYWLPSSRGRSEAAGAGRIHPLVHANTSSLSEERFTSEFTGQEPFFADHVVEEERVLPGVAYLEMARRAVQEAVGGEGEVGEHGIELHHVVWSQPIVQRGAEAVRVHVQVENAEGSEPAEGWTLRYEIYSGGAGVSGERVVHSQGYARLVEKQPAPRVDVSELRSRCEQERSGASCYAAFDAMGLHYGPSHRGLVSVWRGEETGGERFALARVQLPASAMSGREEYVLHPSVLDSALQATIALGDGQTLRLPFALDAVEVFGASPPSGYVVIREERGGEGGGKLTLELCDDAGVVCVRLAGFASRAQHRSGVELLQRRWRHSPVEQPPQSGHVQRWVLLDSAYGSQVAALSERLPGAQITTLRAGAGAGAGVAEEFEQVVEQVMATVQTILRERPRGEVLLQIALSRGERGERLGAVSGLLKSASQENPKLVGQVLELEDSATLLDKLEENAAARGDVEIRYQGGERQTPALEPVVESRAAGVEVPWKQDGVYLITGGAGGLGLLFAKEIIDRAAGATLILTGRSRLSGTKQAAVESLRGRGSRVEYMQLDVSDGAAVSRAVEQLQSEHGGLNGLVHAAGVLQDSFVVNKTEAQWRSVLGPKVRGLVHLDEATKHLPLDHMVVFSSVAGLVGNVGQADYAAANAFMARFAEQRSELVRAGRRQGRTVAIDWPLWESGGMQMDASTVQRLRQTHGVIPLATEHGIAAFYRTMASGLAHVGVFATEASREALTDADDDSRFYMELFETMVEGVLSEDEFREWLVA
ncbi:SDR family NAD(P)-dependent oxidoreductase [Sorangium sp. KYC3313]|uniref:SDR family NAD(P)-dependent oxidoreductase n=1 Tax=Sorangium sp. KYC3313 TaxID=3449740 RepID=UPI003F89B669